MPAPITIAIKMDGHNQVVSAVQQVSQQFTSFQQTLQAGFNLNLGAKLADTVLQAVGAFRQAISEGLRYAGSLKDLSLQTGLTAEAVQVLGLSAAQSGAGIENVRTALTNLRQAATAAQAGNRGLAAAFTQLGLDAQTLIELPLAAQLEAVGRAFAASGGDGRAYAALIQLLGERDVPRLQGLLQDLARSGLAGMADALRSNGALLTSELIETADEIGDRWGVLQVKLQATFAELGILLKPFIDGIQWVISVGLSGLQLITRAFQNLANAIGAIAAVLAGASFRDAFAIFLALSDRSRTGDLLGAPPPPSAQPTTDTTSRGPSTAELIAEQRRLVLSQQSLDAQRAAAIAEVTRAEQALDRVISEGHTRQKIDTAALTAASLALTAAKAGQAKLDAQISAELDRQRQQSDAIVALEASFLPLEQQRLQARAALTDAEQTVARLLADQTTDANAILAAELQRLNARQALATLKETLARTRAEAANQAALDSADSAARQLAAQRATLDGDFTRTEQERFAERARLLAQEIANQRELLALLQARRDAALAAGDTTGAAVFDQSARQVGTGLDTLVNQQARLGPDPFSFVQQSQSALAQLLASWSTSAEQIGQAIAGTIGTAVSTISSSLSGLILRTTTWRQALANIGTTILTSVVNSIVQLGVRWVATQVLMAVAGKAIQAASAAATIPLAAAQSAIWSGPATLATIATFGGAALAAPGFIAASTALTKAQSLLPGFSAGGFTGDTGGLVHPREFVFSAPAVAALGLDRLTALHDSALSPSAAPSPPLGGAPADAGAAPRVYLLMDRAAFARAMQEDSSAWFQDMSHTFQRKQQA